MSCGFGAVVLVFLIIDHSLEVEIRTVTEVLSEVELLEEDIREGEAGLVRHVTPWTMQIWISWKPMGCPASPRSLMSMRH